MKEEGSGAEEGSAVMKISDLRVRDVVNVRDGKKLGNVSDLELDLEQGRITALVVPGPGRFLGIFGRYKDYVIPWEKIIRIGVDVILVELDTSTTLRSNVQRGARGSGLVAGPWAEERQ